MNSNRRTGRWVAGAVLVVAASTVTTACTSTVAGSGTADSSAVASYAAAVTAARTATMRAVCTEWEANYTKRRTADRALVAYSKTSNANWDGAIPLVNAERSTIAAELGALPGLISRAGVAPVLAEALTSYRTSLTAFDEGLRADAAARATTGSFARSNAAKDGLTSAATRVDAACPG